MPVESARVEQEGDAGGEHELADLEAGPPGARPLEPGSDLAGLGGPGGGIVERRAVAVQDDTVSLRVVEDDPAVGRDVGPQRNGKLRPLLAGSLERDHLAEPRLVPALEHDVAAGLDGELVQRGLERESPAVDRRGEREDRPLQLGAEVPVLGQPAFDLAHATSLHSSMATSMPPAPSSNSTVQASSITL